MTGPIAPDRPTVNRMTLLAAAALVLNLIVFPPLKAYSAQFHNFNFALWQPFATELVLGGAAFLFLVLIFAILPAQAARRFFQLCCGLALWFWLKSSFMQWHYPPFEGASVDWDEFRWQGAADYAVLAACLATPFLFEMRVRRWLLLWLKATTLISLAYCAILLYSSTHNYSIALLRHIASVQEIPRTEERLSRSHNAFVLILDTMQSDTFGELVKADPQWQQRLAGFTWYRDAASMTPITGTSVPIILTGHPYTSSQPYIEYLYDAFEADDGILKRFGEHGYYREIERWGMATPLPPVDGLAENQTASVFPLVSEVERLTVISGFDILPQALQILTRDAAADFSEDAIAWGNEDSNARFVDQAASLPTVLVDAPVLRIYHLKGTHIPLRPAAARPGAKGRKVPYTRANVLAMQSQVLKSVALFVDKLKRAGVLDNSLIVVTGDHGGGRMNLELDPSFLEAGATDRPLAKIQAAASPLLMIHFPNATGALATSDAPVTLADIPCTLEKTLLEPAMPCRGVAEWKDHEARSRPFYFLNSTNLNSRGYLNTLIRPYEIHGAVRDPDSWTTIASAYAPEGVRKEPRPIYVFGSDFRFNNTSSTRGDFDFGWARAGERGAVWSDGQLSQISLPINSSPRAGTLEMEVALAPLQDGKTRAQRLQMFANGIDLGTQTITHDQTLHFALPEGVLSPSNLVLRFALPDAVNPISVGASALDLSLGIYVHRVRVSVVPAA